MRERGERVPGESLSASPVIARGVMGFLDGTSYLQLPSTSGTWIVQDWLPQGGLLNIYGTPKTGKSFLSIQLAEAIANPQRNWLLNMPVLIHGPVAYLQIDTPRSLWLERLSVDLASTDLKWGGVWFADLEIVPFPFNILGSGSEWLRQACDEIKPVCVVVDTLREAYNGEENDSGVLRNVVNAFMSSVMPAALVFVSHARKNSGDDSSLMGDQRGSSYLAGRMDCILRVSDKILQYRGRAVAEEIVKIRRTPQYLLEIADEYEVTIQAIVESMPGATARAIARAAQEQFPKRSFDAIRSVVRRRLLASRSIDGVTRRISFD